MSHRALGGQFQTIYRGLNEVSPSEITTPHNIHWTHDANSASNFALNRDEWGYARESGYDEDEPPYDRGTVIEARVHPKDIVPRGTEEHERLSESEGILHEGSFENETTIRPGATVHVVAHHYLEQGENHDAWKTTRLDQPRPERVK